MSSNASAGPSCPKMDLDSAIVAHGEWKELLSLYALGDRTLDGALVSCDDRCTVGRWLLGEGRRYANEAAYEEAVAQHAQLHQCAGEIVRAVDAGKLAEARAMLAPGASYSRLSRGVVGALVALKRRVEDKTSLAMRALELGVLLVDAGGLVQSGYSAACHSLLGKEVLAGRALADVLGLDEEGRALVDVSLSQAFEEPSLAEVALALLPARVPVKSRLLGVRTAPLRDGVALEYVLVTFTDETELARVEADSAEGRAVMCALRDREGFTRFVAAARGALAEALPDSQERARRLVHTIKGNAALFELASLVALAGEIEDRPYVGYDDLMSLGVELRSFLARHEEVLGIEWGSAERGVHRITEAELALYEEAIGAGDAAEAVASGLIARLRKRTASSMLGPIEDRARALGERLDKLVRCEVVGGDTLVSPSAVAGVFASLSHCLRNAIDHGLESPDERRAAGKPSEGLLRIEVRESPGLLQLTFTDDGRGIDPERLAARALEASLVSREAVAAMSREDKLALVFLDGLSTADDVTDISGRGVGTAAVAAAVRQVGGALRIRSELGRGTSFVLELPSTPRAGHRPSPARSGSARVAPCGAVG